MKVTKRISVGAFAKRGFDYQDGDVVKILNDGVVEEGKFGEQHLFKMGFLTGEKNLGINQTSLNKLIDVFGDDTASWVGKDVKLWVVKQNVAGRFTDVTYVTAPNQQLGDEVEEIFQH